MPRKGENIRKRKDGRWEARYEKCRDQNGRIQYGYLYGRTYEAVKKKKLAVLCQNNLQNSPGKCYVFRNLSEEWMLSMRYAVKLSTYACYETLLDTHILPEFGDMPLKYISSASVYSFSEKLKQQGLSPRTIKNLLILFHSILRYGEKQGYLNLSQLEFRYPKINTSPFQLISHEHLTKLITVLSAEDSEFPIGILLCIYTGIRVGELSGIRWEDIDFDKKLLHIRRTISRIKNLDYSGESDEEPKTVLMIGPPKSVSSIRDIPIPDFLLKKMKRIAAEPDSYLLTGTNRKCMEPRNIQRKFQKLLQQCEIPSINIHSLRHAFATRCTEMGFDSKTLSEILGHSSVKITMDIYVHSSIKQKQKCMEKLKSCSELVTHSYKNSFFNDDHVAISTARAGNVIGGGDFANDRIIPDCIRAAIKHEDIVVRNPFSTRPYQHVLEPLYAYLMIAAMQYQDIKYAGYYNVGPDDVDCFQTGALVDLFVSKWGDGMKWVNRYDGGPHEANFLKLDCSKLKTTFGWKPHWNLDTAIEMVVEWSKCWVEGGDIRACMDNEIKLFMES